jgi:hypothetical protein
MEKRKITKWAKSLKTLREIIGKKNQEQFAELVGVSIALIKFAESGRVPVTRKLGMKIQVATGAVIGTSKITANGFGPYEPLPENAVISGWNRNGGVPFTLEKFKEHREQTVGQRGGDDLVRTLKSLLKAASEPGQRTKGKLNGLRWSFIEWAQESIERFNLQVGEPSGINLPVPPLRDASKSSRPQSRRASR